MSQFPDDKDLIEFLRQHRSVPPPPGENLEEVVMSAIGGSPQSSQKQRYLWLVPSAIAATLLATVLSYRTLNPPQPSATELALLEDFMETNWHNTVNDSGNEFLPVNDEQ